MGMSGDAGLPPGAIRRLRQIESEEGKETLFTSDLSVNEFLLVRAGYAPLGLVMGCCVCHVRFQYVGRRAGTELTALTEAMYAAREIAMGRMQHEASRLEAHGVVGVRIVQGSYSWGRGLIEFLATGTAVRRSRRERRSLVPRFALDLRYPAAPTSPGSTISPAW